MRKRTQVGWGCGGILGLTSLRYRCHRRLNVAGRGTVWDGGRPLARGAADPNLLRKRARSLGRDPRSLSMNAVLGDLPTWNLSDLYSSPTGTDLGADLKRATAAAGAFAKDYEGKVVSLAGK